MATNTPTNTNSSTSVSEDAEILVVEFEVKSAARLKLTLFQKAKSTRPLKLTKRHSGQCQEDE